MLSLPAEIVVSDFILSHIKPTRDIAMALFGVFSGDFDNMRFWLRGEKMDSVDAVLNGLVRAYNCDKMHMFEIMHGGELIGEIGFASINEKNKTVYVDYWLTPNARGYGIIDKMLPVIEKMAFEDLNMNKVILGIDVENTASRKVAERNEYKLDGVLRENKMWVDGSVHDECVYSKLKSEWIKEQKNA